MSDYNEGTRQGKRWLAEQGQQAQCVLAKTLNACQQQVKDFEMKTAKQKTNLIPNAKALLSKLQENRVTEKTVSPKKREIKSETAHVRDYEYSTDTLRSVDFTKEFYAIPKSVEGKAIEVFNNAALFIDSVYNAIASRKSGVKASLKTRKFASLLRTEVFYKRPSVSEEDGFWYRLSKVCDKAAFRAIVHMSTPIFASTCEEADLVASWYGKKRANLFFGSVHNDYLWSKPLKDTELLLPFKRLCMGISTLGTHFNAQEDPTVVAQAVCDWIDLAKLGDQIGYLFPNS